MAPAAAMTRAWIISYTDDAPIDSGRQVDGALYTSLAQPPGCSNNAPHL